MPMSRAGRAPGSLPAFALRLATILAAASLSACASSSAHTPEPTARVSQSARYAAAANGGYVVEMEEDGIPAQTPPPLGRPRTPDDPSEPFSPNYGRAAAAPNAPLPVARPLADAAAAMVHDNATPGATSEPHHTVDTRWQRTRLSRGALAVAR